MAPELRLQKQSIFNKALKTNDNQASMY